MSLEEKKYSRVEARLAKKQQKQHHVKVVLNRKLLLFEEKKFGIERSFSEIKHSKIRLFILRRMQELLRRFYEFSHHRLKKLCGDSSQAEQRLGQILTEMILRQISSSFHGHICDVASATLKRKSKVKKHNSKHTNPNTAMMPRVQNNSVSSQVSSSQNAAVPARDAKKKGAVPSVDGHNNSSRTVKPSEWMHRGKTRSDLPVTVSRVADTNPWQTIQRDHKPKPARRARSSHQPPSHIQDKPGKLSSKSKLHLGLHLQPGVAREEQQKHRSQSSLKGRREASSFTAGQERIAWAKHDSKRSSAAVTGTDIGPKLIHSTKQNNQPNNIPARKQNNWPHRTAARERKHEPNTIAWKQQKTRPNNNEVNERKAEPTNGVSRERKAKGNDTASKDTKAGPNNSAMRERKVKPKNSASKHQKTKATNSAPKEQKARTSDTVARALKNGSKVTAPTEQKAGANRTVSTERNNESNNTAVLKQKAGPKNNLTQKNASSKSAASKERKAGPRITAASARNVRQNIGPGLQHVSATESNVGKSGDFTSALTCHTNRADSTHKLAANIDRNSLRDRIAQPRPKKPKAPSDTIKTTLSEASCANKTNMPSNQRASDVFRQEGDLPLVDSLASQESVATCAYAKVTGPRHVSREETSATSSRHTSRSDTAVLVQVVSPLTEAQMAPSDSAPPPSRSITSSTNDTKQSNSPSALQNRDATVANTPSEQKREVKTETAVPRGADTRCQTEASSSAADSPVKPQTNLPTQFSADSQSWFPALQKSVYGPPLSYPGLPAAGAFPVPMAVPHVAHGFPAPFAQAPPFGICMPMYLLPPHIMNHPDTPFVAHAFYNHVASVPEGPKSGKQPNQDTTESILLPFMSIMMHSLYYIPAMREAVASKSIRGKMHSVLVGLRDIFDLIRSQASPARIPYHMCTKLCQSLRKHCKMETPSSTPDAWEMILGALHSVLCEQPLDDAAIVSATADETIMAVKDVKQRESNSAKRAVSVEYPETVSKPPTSFVSDIFHLNLVSKTDCDCPVNTKALAFSVSTTAMQAGYEHASDFGDLLMRAYAQSDLLLDKVELSSPTAVFTLALIWPHREQMREHHTHTVLDNLKPAIPQRMFSDTGPREAALIVCHGFGAHSAFVQDESSQWLW